MQYLTSKRRVQLLVTLFMLLTVLALNAHAGDLLVLQPQGPVAAQERNLIFIITGLMLVVLIPVFAMTVWLPWHYRAGNKHALHMPKWDSAKLDVIVWLIPAVIVASLAAITWIYTHDLDPYKPLASDAKPLKVQVVALDWKWLFIYPEQGIATVNKLVIPTNRPVDFDITSDTVMNSFFIPQLGSQIYAMAGMQTQLHLQADKPGVYLGENTQFSGRGFPYQHFKVLAEPDRDFNTWVKQAKHTGKDLNWASYQKLEKPSVNPPPQQFAGVDKGMFTRIMNKYTAAQPAS